LPVISPGTLLGDLLVGAAGALLGQHHLLHHLAHDAVGKNHYRIGVLESQIETESYEIDHLLHRTGSQDDHAVVTVAASLAALEIIGLRGLDRA